MFSSMNKKGGIKELQNMKGVNYSRGNKQSTKKISVKSHNSVSYE
jgi:hypothetical protein